MCFPRWLVLVFLANDILETTELVRFGISDTGDALRSQLSISLLRVKAFQRLTANAGKGS